MKPDLKAHLLGGIPMIDVNGFDNYWKVAPNLKNELFSNNSKKGYYNLNVDKDNISEIIKQSNEINDYLLLGVIMHQGMSYIGIDSFPAQDFLPNKNLR